MTYSYTSEVIIQNAHNNLQDLAIPRAGTWACQYKVVLLKVTTVKGLGVFWRILFRWKASVYKSVWYNLLLYILLYSSLSITYRYFLSEEQRVLYFVM